MPKNSKTVVFSVSNAILRSFASVCNRQYAYAKNRGFPQILDYVRNVPQNCGTCERTMLGTDDVRSMLARAINTAVASPLLPRIVLRAARVVSRHQPRVSLPRFRPASCCCTVFSACLLATIQKSKIVVSYKSSCASSAIAASQDRAGLSRNARRTSLARLSGTVTFSPSFCAHSGSLPMTAALR